MTTPLGVSARGAILGHEEAMHRGGSYLSSDRGGTVEAGYRTLPNSGTLVVTERNRRLPTSMLISATFVTPGILVLTE